jgi:hypothetical protein
MPSHNYQFSTATALRLIALPVVPLVAFAIVLHLAASFGLLPPPQPRRNIDQPILRAVGWTGLSAATAAGWLAAFLLIARWAGPWRQGARFHVLWMLGLWALQRRMVLRPDMFSMLAFGIGLLALDAFARGKTRALALVPLAHLLWTNSHQL